MNSPSKTTTKNDLTAQLQQIGLRALPENLDDFLARASKARWSSHMLLEELCRSELQERSRRSLERRLRLSAIKSFKPLADFEWNWPTKIDRDVIERALTLDFLQQARNLVLVGRNGLGKTLIAKNICHAAVLAGHSVLFRTAPAILEDLQSESLEGRRRKLRGYANVGLLCVDEVGYLSYDDKAADILFEVINRHYERKSLIVTTNRIFKEWNEVFPNATCIATMLDRLLHHADVTVIEGARISDTTTLAVNSLHGNKLQLYQAKTGEPVSVPITRTGCDSTGSRSSKKPAVLFLVGTLEDSRRGVGVAEEIGGGAQSDGNKGWAHPQAARHVRRGSS